MPSPFQHQGLGGGVKDAPTDYGRHHARCKRCGYYLNRYHSPTADGGLCHPCAPGGEGGIVIEVAEGEWRRFATVEDLRTT